MATAGIDRAEVEENVLAAAEGEQDAFDWLVECYGRMVWSVIRSHGLNDADAHDAFQTTWLRLVEHLDRIREPRAVGGWLASTSRHESLRLLRHTDRARPTPEEQFDQLEDAAEAVEHDLIVVERDDQLWAAFNELGQRCRTLLRLLMADPPLSYEEVSQSLDIPIGSIGPTRGRCLGQLRGHLRTRGITS